MERPNVNLAVIVMRKEKVLLGKRKSAYGEGIWMFPLGYLEFCKGFEDCALRKLGEKVGFGFEVELIDKTPSAVTNDIFEEENEHYVTLFMRAEYISGEPERSDTEKCEEWGWFYWVNLPKPLFLPVQNLIKQRYNPFLVK